MLKTKQHCVKTTFSIGLITLFASVHLTSNTMVAAQENSYSTNQNTQSYTETSIIETTTTKVYEEIIEESGEVTPGAPGSFDDDTTTPATTEPLESEPPTEITESSVEATDSTAQSTTPAESSTTTSINQGTAPNQTETTSFITRIITGNQTTANNNRNQGKVSNNHRPLFKESQAHSLTKLLIKKYLQTNMEKYPDIRFWSYALLTMTTGKAELLNPVVMPLVVMITEILTNY
ncbi:hypothetical protein ACWOBH_01700 [Globicatella sanguinis]